jgi:hypothetical protein
MPVSGWRPGRGFRAPRVTNFRKIGKRSRVRRRDKPQMRTARAYVAGFGTAGSLLAGAALLFVLASALVAFHGWPQVGAAAAPVSVTVGPASGAGGSSVARRLAAILAPAAAPAIGLGERGARSGASGSGAGARLGGGPRRRRTAVPGSAPASRGTGVVSRGPVASGSPVASGAGGGGGSGGGGPGSAVRRVLTRTVGAVRRVVRSGGDQLGAAIRQTESAARGAVRTVAQTVAGAVNVLPPPAG